MTLAAVPDSTYAALCKGSAVDKLHALHPSASDFALPAAAKIQGDATAHLDLFAVTSVAIHGMRCSQEHGVISIIGCPAFLPNISIHSGKVQISASLHQLYKGNGIVLLMHTLATLSLDLKVLGRLAGFADSVQMATCTAGQHLCTIGLMAVSVLSAAATKCASTTP